MTWIKNLQRKSDIFCTPIQHHACKKAMCVRLIASIRSLKTEIHKVQVSAGGNKLEYNGKPLSYPTRLTTVKIHLKIKIPTNGAIYITLDIKYLYYETPIKIYEYAHIQLKLTPGEILNQYNLIKIILNGWVYTETRKRVPGLKQSLKNAQFA